MAADKNSTANPSYAPSASPNYQSGSSAAPQAADVAIELQQLSNLREQTVEATTNHLRTQLSQKLPTEQVGRLLNHPNTKLELTRLIHKVVLSPHQNLDSYTYAIAKGITEIAEPHLRLAANIATASSGKDSSTDILQEALRTNANIKSSYNPLTESLKPIEPNSQTSKLAAKIKSPLVIDKEGVPSLKPEIEKIVAAGLKNASPEKTKQISDALHQDLIAETLTHQPTHITSTQDLIKTHLQKHDLDTNQISQSSYNHFIDYVNRYHQDISTNDNVASIQIAAEANNISAESLQQGLTLSGETSENTLHELLVTPSPKPPASPPPSPPPPTYKAVDQQISQADSYHYDQSGQSSNPSAAQNRIFQIIRRINSLTSSQRQGVFSQFQIRFRSFFENLSSYFSPGVKVSSGPTIFQSTPEGSPSPLNSMGKTAGGWAKNATSQAAQAAGNAAKSLAKTAGKAAIQAGKAALKAAGKAFSQFATKALILNPYFWIGVVVVIILAALIYILAGASPQKVAIMQADTISGQGGSGLGLGFCDPEADENCIPLFCEGDCSCPVTGYITQAPGGDYSHLINGNPVNAVDIGLTNGDPVYSLSSGTVTFAAYSPVGYGNLVVVDNPDGTQLYYAHLEWFNVSIGQQVAVGEQVGAGDNTGNSSGPHLHLEYRGAGAQNVLALIGFSPEQIEALNGCSGTQDCGYTLCQN